MNLGVVGVLPVWSQATNLNADSNYSLIRTVLPEMARRTPDTVWVVFFPDPRKGAGKWKYTPDGLTDEPNITIVHWPYDTAMLSSFLSFDPDLYRKLEKAYGFTGWWLHQVESGCAFQGGYAQSANKSGRPWLLAQQHYIIHESLPYTIESNFARLWMQAGGALVSSRVLYNSNYARNMEIETLGNLLHPSQIRKLEDKSRTIRFGMAHEDDPEAPETGDGYPPVVIYNHRFESYKRPKLTAEALKPLRRERKFEVWVTQAAKQNVGDFPVDKVVFAPGRREYLENIAVPAINTMNSQHETFCISVMDSMSVGHLLVLPNAITFPELVPKGYPFLFKNEKEQQQMLRTILRRWPHDYDAWTMKLRNHARKNFNVSAYADRILEEMAECEMATRREINKPQTVEALETVFDNLNTNRIYSVPEVGGKLRQGYNLGSQSMGAIRVVREANKRGIRFLPTRDGVGMVKRDG